MIANLFHYDTITIILGYSYKAAFRGANDRNVTTKTATKHSHFARAKYSLLFHHYSTPTNKMLGRLLVCPSPTARRRRRKNKWEASAIQPDWPKGTADGLKHSIVEWIWSSIKYQSNEGGGWVVKNQIDHQPRICSREFRKWGKCSRNGVLCTFGLPWFPPRNGGRSGKSSVNLATN